MNTFLGKLHFWPSLILMNCIFLPMLIQGLYGVNRRLYDGGATYDFMQPVMHWNSFMSASAFLLGIAQLPFIFNFFWSIFKGEKTDSNPWKATTLDWAATSSPPLAHGNFETVPVVHRGPYEYSVPGDPEDYSPQHKPLKG